MMIPLQMDVLKRILCRFLPYPVGARALRGLARLPAVTHLLRRRLDPINRLLKHLQLAGPTANLIQRRHLGLAVLGSWRYCALTRARLPVWNRWVRITGFEHITNLLDKGYPVIVLNSHYGLGHVANVALARLGIASVSMPMQNRLDATYHIDSTGSGETLQFIELGRTRFQLQGLARARTVLDEGKVLHLAGDGFSGESSVLVPFMGRQRALRAGFAYLSHVTGAQVIPVFATLKPSGDVLIEFETGLTRPAAGQSQREAVAAMVTEYGKRLEDRWRQDPSQVTDDQIRLYLASLG